MAHATQKLSDAKPVKHSVQFKADEKDKYQLFSSVYLLRKGAEKLLGVKDLDEIESIEITVRVK